MVSKQCITLFCVLDTWNDQHLHIQCRHTHKKKEGLISYYFLYLGVVAAHLILHSRYTLFSPLFCNINKTLHQNFNYTRNLWFLMRATLYKPIEYHVVLPSWTTRAPYLSTLLLFLCYSLPFQFELQIFTAVQPLF